MRTAIFYSSKGGSGRTLTLANIACLLVRIGYDVLTIDLDLEAPGVPEALAGIDAKTDANDGFVEYAKAWLAVGPSPAAPRPRLPIVELQQHAQSSRRSEKGPRLRLVRAGDYGDPVKYNEYAKFMWSGSLEGLYPLPGDDAYRVGSQERDPEEAEYIKNYTAFWADVREHIAADAPDYLLVDTRTGFSPLSATTVDAFLTDLAGSPDSPADLFVFGELGSEASRLGTRAFVAQTTDRLRRSSIPRRTWIVRREQALAQSVDSPASHQTPEAWLTDDDDNVDWTAGIDGYRRIRSDPEVELSGARLAAPDGPLTHRALLDDYVSLTSLLVDALSEEDLRDELQLGRAESYKLFKLLGSGAMFNVADSQPNVSFTERTFHSLIGHVLGGPTLPTPQSLTDAGKRAGVEFATTFKERAQTNVREAVARWQDLESASGWGLFDLVPGNVAHFLAHPEPVIRVKHNAFAPPPGDGTQLASQTDDGPAAGQAEPAEGAEEPQSTISIDRDPNLCAFLAGYLSGILSTLTGVEFESDPTAHEFCRSNAFPYCEFKFTRLDRPFHVSSATLRERPKICLLYTGGTIGMRRDYKGDLRPPDDPKDFLRLAPELRDIVEFDFEVLLNKDSTNVVPSDWTQIAQAIYDRRDAGYTGFVVVHGTDTMHFSASAVAFALGPGLRFPVVFTGAQTIPEVQHGDARTNLLRACAVAKEDLAEVVIAFGDYIFRGARAQKKDERKFDAFESPAMFPLGDIAEDIRISQAAYRRKDREGNPFVLENRFETGVLQVSLIPGLEPSLLGPAISARDFKGLILQSFGAGNVPDEDAAEYSVIPIIKMAVEHEKPVIVTSQFPANTTQGTAYAPGRKAIDAGAIPTGNMTASCAVAKFRWALALPAIQALEASPIERFRQLEEVMSQSYVGELDEDVNQDNGR